MSSSPDVQTQSYLSHTLRDRRRYSPHHEGTHLAKLDNISRPLLQRYCEQNAELQIIVIASTLRGRDTSEDEWERWLEPWLNLKTYISFSKKIGCTKRQWDELKLRERAQQVVKAAATLDIEVAIENVSPAP